MFNNLADIKESLKMDKLLQRSVAFLMEAEHYPVVVKSGFIEDRLVIRMMIHYIRHTVNSDKVSCFMIYLTFCKE